MNTTRRVVRTQQAQYVEGSRAKGFLRFSIQGTERRGASLAYFDLQGERCATREEAVRSAWQTAREWVAELGEVAKTEDAYTSEREEAARV